MKSMVTVAALYSVSMLALSTPTTAFPAYGFKDGDVWTYTVKAKVEVQPYSTGGVMTLAFGTMPNGKDVKLTVTHKAEMEMNGEKGPGGEFVAVYGMNRSLCPTGGGDGLVSFAPQLLAALLMPNKAEERLAMGGNPFVFASKVEAEKDLTKVSSTAKGQVEEYAIEKWLDKSGRLVRAKVVTTSGIGKTSFELLPTK